MIFGTPVSGFEKKNEEIIWKKVLAVQPYAEFGLEESCGGETASRRRARRHMPGRVTVLHDRRKLSEWHQPGCLILEAGRKPDASPRLLLLDLAVGSARQSCPKNRNVSAGLGLVRIPDPPGRRSVGGREPSFSPPPFLRLRSGSCSTHTSKTHSNSQLNR